MMERIFDSLFRYKTYTYLFIYSEISRSRAAWNSYFVLLYSILIKVNMMIITIIILVIIIIIKLNA